MSTLTSLSAVQISQAVTTFADLLQVHRDAINRLNVYPVPDGDTGTNMAMTMESVRRDIAALGDDPVLADLCHAIAHGSLMGARGNSGIILSQMLRGFTGAFAHCETVGRDELVAGFVAADALARQAVAHPVEGTILSVASAAATASAQARDLADVVTMALDAARVALEMTPTQLEVLRLAGVVDSGGTGLVLWFASLAHVVAGVALPPPPRVSAALAPVLCDEGHGEGTSTRYEVMFLLHSDRDDVATLRQNWMEIGDSVVIVGGDGLYNCHIHTNDIGASIESALPFGRPESIRVTDLMAEVAQEHEVRRSAMTEVPSTPAPTTAVVAVTVGEGNHELLSTLGVRSQVVGGQTMNPSTADLVAAVRRTGSSQVIVLPNNRNIRAVAEQLNDIVDGVDIAVIPTGSLIEGMSAMLAYRPDDSLAENVERMRPAAHAVRAGEVTQAVRATATTSGEVRVGDWIGVTPDGVVAIASTVTDAATALIGVLASDGGELVTILEGDGANTTTTADIRTYLAATYPHLEVEVHHGGQPLYPYFVGVE